MLDLGIVKPGSTIYVPFQTFDSNDPQASVTITGLATTDVEIYKDGSVTQRASDSGYALLDTDGIDFDTTTGIHGISIDLADNTTAGFYASGSQYWVVIASITVDAATINFIPVTFRIGYPDALLNTTIATLASQTSFTLTSGPAEDSALDGCIVAIHGVASAVQMGFAVVSAYTGATKTVTLTAGTTFTAAATDNIHFYPPANVNYIQGTAQTANDNGADINTLLTRIVGTLAAGTHNPASAAQIAVLSDWIDGGRLDLLLDAIKVVTDAQAATGTGLTAIPWNAAWDAEVQSEVNDGLVAFFTSAAQLVDDIWDEPIAGHLTAGTSGLSEALGGAALVDGAITGTPTATVFTFTGGNVNDNFYNDQLVYILSGTGTGQVKPILSSAYSGGTTTITVDESFTVTPAAADRFAILVSHVHPKTQISAQIMADIDANGSTVIDELTTQGDTNETKLDTLTTQVGTAGAGLTDLGGMSTSMKAEVNAEADTALSDYDAATGTELAAVDAKIDTIDSNVDAVLADTASIGITKNAAFSNLEFLMVDATDFVTPETGLTVTGERSIDGGAFAGISGSIAEVGNGIYQVDLAAADTNGDVITYRFTSAGAADRFITIKTRA